MKTKLTLVFCLLASICFAQLPTTQAETAAWLGRELSANEVRFFPFIKARYRQAQDEKVLTVYAWIEVDAGQLGHPIPQEALNQFFGTSTDEEGVETPNVTGLLLKDFTYSVEPSLDETKAMIRLGAKNGNTYRLERVTADDAADWMSYLNAYGYTDEDLLAIDQHAETLESAEYSAGETI